MKKEAIQKRLDEIEKQINTLITDLHTELARMGDDEEDRSGALTDLIDELEEFVMPTYEE